MSRASIQAVYGTNALVVTPSRIDFDILLPRHLCVQ